MNTGKILTLSAMLLIASTACQRTTEAPPPQHFDAGGDFTLIDQDGARFELASLRGKVVMLFFGYASCPDACPMTLSRLASVTRSLGADAERVKTVYITIDPERDTPAVLKADLANFAVNAVGLTGTRAEIDKVVAQYGAAYEIVPSAESASKTSITHTTTIYLLDGAGVMRRQYRSDTSVDKIVEGVRSIL